VYVVPARSHAKLRTIGELDRVRVSDAERDAALAQLREHAASGRLSLDELDDRSGRVLAARTRGELDRALGDLPDLASWGYRLRHLSLQTHVLLYAAANVALLALWEATREQERGPTDDGLGYWWPFSIVAVWGVVLLAHAARAVRRPRRRALSR
jgi:hypothetical protein